MSMMTKLLTASAVAAVMTAGAAQAATLSFSGGTAASIPTNFDLQAQTGLLHGLSGGQTFTSANMLGNGLSVSGPTELRFTFLGKEAGATNWAFRGPASGLADTPSDGSGGNTTLMFNNQTSAVGDSVSFFSLAGLVNFLFETSGLPGAPNNVTAPDGIQSGPGVDQFAIIRNGTGADDTRISMTLFNRGGSVIALFGDGRGDNDMDDMAVEITAVPVPAAGFLLLGALGGLAALRRRKTDRKTA